MTTNNWFRIPKVTCDDHGTRPGMAHTFTVAVNAKTQHIVAANELLLIRAAENLFKLQYRESWKNTWQPYFYPSNAGSVLQYLIGNCSKLCQTHRAQIRLIMEEDWVVFEGSWIFATVNTIACSVLAARRRLHQDNKSGKIETIIAEVVLNVVRWFFAVVRFYFARSDG